MSELRREERKEGEDAAAAVAAAAEAGDDADEDAAAFFPCCCGFELAAAAAAEGVRGVCASFCCLFCALPLCCVFACICCGFFIGALEIRVGICERMEQHPVSARRCACGRRSLPQCARREPASSGVASRCWRCAVGGCERRFRCTAIVRGSLCDPSAALAQCESAAGPRLFRQATPATTMGHTQAKHTHTSGPSAGPWHAACCEGSIRHGRRGVQARKLPYLRVGRRTQKHPPTVNMIRR